MLRIAYPKCLVYVTIVVVSMFCCSAYGEPNDANSSQGEPNQKSKESEVKSLGLNRTHRKAKWARMDAWRKKLKKGMDESAVRGLLGDPKYISRGSHVSVWYYQNMPDCVHNKTGNEIKRPRYGYVNFYNINPKMYDLGLYGDNASSDRPPLINPEFEVDIWGEPNWASLDQNSIYEAEPKEKHKSSRRHQVKWQDISQWGMLQIGMREENVRVVLGEPKIVKIDRGGKTWIYTEGYAEDAQLKEGATIIKHLGVLQFKEQRGTYLLIRWDEPFWPDVENELSKEEH